MFDPAADPVVPYDKFGASRALTKAGWDQKDDGWYLPDAKKPITLEVLSPTQGTNPGLFAAAEAVVRDWTSLGFKVTHVALPPAEFVTDRLATGDFQVAVVDVTVGLDPDLYPLLASSQTLTGGSNVMGVQDPALDALLVKARARRAPRRPAKAPTARCRSSWRRVDTCFRWPSRTRSWWPATRSKDPFCGRLRTPRIDFGMC